MPCDQTLVLSLKVSANERMNRETGLQRLLLDTAVCFLQFIHCKLNVHTRFNK